MTRHNEKRLLECILCSSMEHKLIYEFDSLPKFKKFGAKRNIVECSKCGLTFCKPGALGVSMLEIYENDYWQEFQLRVGEKQLSDRIDDFEFVSRERMFFIKKFVKKGTLLDVGCSMGFLVDAAVKTGFDACGIDLNIKDINEGVKKYRVELYKKFIHEVEQKDFDVITSFNVIEHVSDPINLLKEMKRRINENGMIVIGTHDVQCNSHKTQRENWKHIIPNEHMFYFSLKTLNLLAEKVGLEEVFHYKPIDNSIVAYYKRRDEKDKVLH